MVLCPRLTSQRALPPHRSEVVHDDTKGLIKAWENVSYFELLLMIKPEPGQTQVEPRHQQLVESLQLVFLLPMNFLSGGMRDVKWERAIGTSTSPAGDVYRSVIQDNIKLWSQAGRPNRCHQHHHHHDHRPCRVNWVISEFHPCSICGHIIQCKNHVWCWWQ